MEMSANCSNEYQWPDYVFTFHVSRFTLREPMNLQQLKTTIRAGTIDTVIVAFPDPFGRLVGKRFCA